MKPKDFYVTPDNRRDGYEDHQHRSRKKTKEWCKGKVGVKHDGKWEPYQSPSTEWAKDWKVFICQNCRKHMKMQYPPLKII